MSATEKASAGAPWKNWGTRPESKSAPPPASMKRPPWGEFPKGLSSTWSARSTRRSAPGNSSRSAKQSRRGLAASQVIFGGARGSSTSMFSSSTTRRSSNPTSRYHPRLTDRRFVLVPLLEIDPEASDPWEMLYKTYLDEAEGEILYLEPF